ncbi:MAG: PEGA domain-containing protein [Bryobacterales bacterium]|nr:PEGA domain-containing protein [Bryobacterales bacterium]
MRLIWTGLMAIALVGAELPSGTKIACRLDQNISSATAEEGQAVQLIATEEVRVGDVVVIPQGSPVIGTVTQAVPKRRMGRTGKLDFSIDKVRTADGKYIPLRYTMQKKEGGSHGTRTGILTALAAIVFWPAAPAFLLMKGKDVTLHKGMAFEVFTDSDFKMSPPAPAPTVSAAPAPAVAAGTATVHITSDVPGADVEIDGLFIGNTPSTRTVTPGNHRVVVKSGAKTWERTLSAQAGDTMNVAATLKAMR